MTNESIRVLHVDDDLVDRQALVRLARDRGLPYEITLARSSEEALSKLEESTFDIVLLDYRLNDGTGLDVLNSVSEVPVIIVTGNGNESVAVEAMRAGAYDYVIKDGQGLYLQLIPETIANVLKRRKDEDERERLFRELQSAVERINDLKRLIPICSQCKKVRDDQGYWQQIEAYISTQLDTDFSHGLCPNCAAQFEDEIERITPKK